MIKGLLMKLNQVTKMVMPYIRTKKLIITLVKKIHTEPHHGNGIGYYLLF